MTWDLKKTYLQTTCPFFFFSKKQISKPEQYFIKKKKKRDFNVEKNKNKIYVS